MTLCSAAMDYCSCANKMSFISGRAFQIGFTHFFCVNFRFPAHRLILIASSKYFKGVLGPTFGEEAEKEIVFADIDALTLSAVLDFIYFGRIEITEENVDSFITAASSMELIGLAEKCGKFWAAKLATENCVRFFLNADKHHLRGLWSIAMKFICDNFEAISSDDIQQIDEKNFRELLNQDQINAAETVIFDRLIQWIDENKEAEERVDSNLLKSIRLAHIPSTVSSCVCCF